MAQKDLLWFIRSLGCIATLKACSACFTAFPLWNLIVSELNQYRLDFRRLPGPAFDPPQLMESAK